MKKLLFLVALVLCVELLSAQSQNNFNYQAVVTDNTGELITNQSVSVELSIIESSSNGTEIYTETHSVTTTNTGQINLLIGNGTSSLGDFASINWGLNLKFIKIGIDAGSGLINIGTFQLFSVPYSIYANDAENAIYADTAGIAKVLGSEFVYTTNTDTLFAVKDRNGNIVFAVFPDGAKVYVNEIAKGKVGGFAVSGRTSVKGVEEDIFIITPDSTRIYVNEVVAGKGKVGGFAVSGRTSTKGVYNDYLQVTKDSTRIYVEEPTGKGKVGGFAVSGRTSTKGKTTKFMSLTPDNYFIGHESGDSITTGLYNSFLGYQSGKNTTEGSNNSFIGYQSGMNNTTGINNVTMGRLSGSSNTTGFNNVYIGNAAGLKADTALYNVFIGNAAGVNATGGHNVFIGNRAGELSEAGDNVFIGGHSGLNVTTGGYNTFVGAAAGAGDTTGQYNTIIGAEAGGYGNGNSNVFLGAWAGTNSNGENNVYIGESVGWSNINGDRNVSVGTGSANGDGSNNVYLGYQSGTSTLGDNNVFIGNNSGRNDTVSNRLYIENSASSSPLIYGEFDNDKVVINGSINYGSTSGTNTYIATISSIESIIEGMSFYIKFSNLNTGTSTININNTGEKSIITSDGLDLIGGELNTGGIHLIIYDGSNFQLLTF